MTKTISLRVDDRLLRAIDSATIKSSKARSEVINEAIELWLKPRATEDKVRRHRDGFARFPVAKDEFSPVSIKSVTRFCSRRGSMMLRES